jgi:hypothetical protein
MRRKTKGTKSWREPLKNSEEQECKKERGEDYERLK